MKSCCIYAQRWVFACVMDARQPKTYPKKALRGFRVNKTLKDAEENLQNNGTAKRRQTDYHLQTHARAIYLPECSSSSEGRPRLRFFHLSFF